MKIEPMCHAEIRKSLKMVLEATLYANRGGEIFLAGVGIDYIDIPELLANFTSFSGFLLEEVEY